MMVNQMMWVNGRAQDALPLNDRGLHYGDGVFETMAVHEGRVPLWPRHWRRLQAGCARLGIAGLDARPLSEEVAALSQGCERGVLKLIVTRGAGGRGYRPPRGTEAGPPTRILIRSPWPDYPAHYWQEGISARLCETRLGLNPALAGLKHLNRLEQVLARREWYDPGIAEGLMCDVSGNVVEGTQSNVFIVRAGCLLTPAVDHCGVAGVMRGFILDHEAAREQAVREAVLPLAELARAEEVFVCNAVTGVWPVRQINAWTYPHGPHTRRVAAACAAVLQPGGLNERQEPDV